jgi:cytochrome c peroxidase
VLKSIFLLTFSLLAFGQDAFQWDIPRPFTRPAVPADNPMSPARVALGRRLFYEWFT